MEARICGPKMVGKQNWSRLKGRDLLAEERKPNPFSYDPVEKKSNDAPKFSFGKDYRGETEKPPDFRKFPEPNYDAIRKVAPKAVILGEHVPSANEALNEFRKGYVGPASYELTHQLTEKRTDVGGAKYVEPTFQKEEEEDRRMLLLPDVSLTKPNHIAFKYHEPTIHGPKHLTDE